MTFTTSTRSSHQRCSIETGVLKNFTKLTGKHLYQSLFLNKVAGLRHRCFPVNFAKHLRIPFLQNTSERLLLEYMQSKCDSGIRLCYMDTYSLGIWDRKALFLQILYRRFKDKVLPQWIFWGWQKATDNTKK